MGIHLNFDSCFTAFWVSIAGGDSWVGIPGRPRSGGRPHGRVSIAGGDSWVGIRRTRTSLPASTGCFNRRWRFLGGDTAGKQENRGKQNTSFNRRWRFLGGDTVQNISKRTLRVGFNRRWRFLGGDTQRSMGLVELRCCFNRRWRFLGGDTRAESQKEQRGRQVSIAGGDSWVGIPRTK